MTDIDTEFNELNAELAKLREENERLKDTTEMQYQRCVDLQARLAAAEEQNGRLKDYWREGGEGFVVELEARLAAAEADAAKWERSALDHIIENERLAEQVKTPDAFFVRLSAAMDGRDKAIARADIAEARLSAAEEATDDLVERYEEQSKQLKRAEAVVGMAKSAAQHVHQSHPIHAAIRRYEEGK